MDKSTIVVGREYAIRERRIVGGPFQRVKLLEHIRSSDHCPLEGPQNLSP
jgi:hypothetical protein